MTVINKSVSKSDLSGRMRYTPDQKKTIVDACLVSGLSAPRFATLHGVNYQTLASWIKNAKMTSSTRSLHPTLLSLVRADIVSSTVGRAVDALEVLLPGGTKLLISSYDQVEIAVALIRALEIQRPC